MTNSADKKLDQLRQAYESGILDEETYRAAVAGLQRADRIHSVTAGTIEGDVATGDNARQIRAETYYENFINQIDPTAPDEADLRRAYLSHLWGQTRGLALTGVDPRTTRSVTVGNVSEEVRLLPKVGLLSGGILSATVLFGIRLRRCANEEPNFLCISPLFLLY